MRKMMIALTACGFGLLMLLAGCKTNVTETFREETKDTAAEAAAVTTENERNNTEAETSVETDVVKEKEIEELSFPILYQDDTLSVEITKEWYANSGYLYCAHVVTSDYGRIGTYVANNKYGTSCTTSEAAGQLGALLTVNGDHMSDELGYTFARSGVLYGEDKPCYAPGIYSSFTGELHDGWEGSATGGTYFSTLMKKKYLSDTFSFGPPFLRDGVITCVAGGSCRPRTFIGYAGTPGEMYICVADGDLNDGKSEGLSIYDCAKFLLDKGCYFGIPLDGGGSSTMVWKGEVINAVKGNERAVVDFLYVK